MPRGGHIHLENHGSIGVEGLAAASTFGHGPDFCSKGLDPAAYGGHTLRTTLSGCILEFTYIGGPTTLLPPTMPRFPTRETRGLWLMANSPTEWL